MPRLQVGDCCALAATAWQVARALLQLLRLQMRYARWALLRPPSEYVPQVHSSAGFELRRILDSPQLAAGALLASPRSHKRADAGRHGVWGCRRYRGGEGEGATCLAMLMS
jgi:hypothetical protein